MFIAETSFEFCNDVNIEAMLQHLNQIVDINDKADEMIDMLQRDFGTTFDSYRSALIHVVEFAENLSRKLEKFKHALDTLIESNQCIADDIFAFYLKHKNDSYKLPMGASHY
ncbi:hypothetical protein YALI2_D00033g [Yarrowia lipolytica]|jgi:predicted RNA-binding protein with EMAP domain|nr:hypothetical protein YALI2_D00033g [Yarrowia lipolytica]